MQPTPRRGRPAPAPASLLGLLLLLLAGTGLAPGPATAAEPTVVTLQPVADTSLFSLTPNNNWGGADFLNAGTAGNLGINRGLMRFDLGGAVPPGSTILNATLTIEVVRMPASGHRNSIFDLHRMLVSWGEGSQAPVPPQDVGLPAGPGEATWNHRFGNALPWGQPGGLPGVDFLSTASSSSFVSLIGDPIEFGSTTALISDVQFWANNPSQNFGWMLSTQQEDLAKTARSFASRESGFGPVLTIEFIPVPEPGLWTLAAAALLLVTARRKKGRVS
ncbi:MAG: hypothetical protein RJA22_2955 [Verrucomicrobiota bacterium]